MSAPHPEHTQPAPQDPRTDRELMADHVNGDRTAFPVLVARHRKQLWNLALRTLRDREDAADALQDGCVKAYRLAGSYRGDAEPGSWLHTIIVRTCLTIIARRRTDHTSLDDANTDGGGPDRNPALVDPADDYATVDSELTVAGMLAQLPTEFRLPVVLIDVEGYTAPAAAELLDVPVNTVKSRLARGRARLAAQLHAQNQERTGDRT